MAESYVNEFNRPAPLALAAIAVVGWLMTAYFWSQSNDLRAQMDDGLLDVCVIGGVNPFKLFCMFPTVYFGKHLNIREVEYFHVARGTIETEHPLDVYADGEYVCRTPVEVGIRPAALRVIVPR